MVEPITIVQVVIQENTYSMIFVSRHVLMENIDPNNWVYVEIAMKAVIHV